MTKKFNWIALLNIVCAVLMLAVFVLQFVPYFIVGDKSLSIQSYVWFSTHHNDVTRVLSKVTDARFPANELAMTAVLSLVMGLLAPILCIKNSKKLGMAIMYVAAGLVCGIGYLTSPVFQTNDLWIVMAAANLAAVALSIPAMVLIAKNIVKWFTVKS